MASRTEQLLIVVSIREGRHFPKSPRLNLVVQASFDGEQLTTDPLEHVEQPHFSTELAWELDRKMLHQHRLQRTPIKLQCFAVDPINKRRENVGYIILDLRSVQEVEKEPRWYPLLSCKYTKQKPALLISMLLEYDRKLHKPSPEKFRAKKAPPRQASPAVMELLPEKLEAVLIPEQGYHQVGPADHCGEMFVLSVTVAFANKLEQLVSSTVKLSAEGSEYYFYYSLLRNDITSEPFRNLLSPDFEAECTCVRIRSSEKILHAFLAQQPPLKVHLCCGSRVLGSTDVPLSALSGVAVDLKSKAATVEGVFVLQPPKLMKQRLPPLPGDLQPTVGVHVSLRREEVPPQSLANKDRNGVKNGAPCGAVAEQQNQIISPVQKHRTAPFSPRVHRYRSPSPHTESEAESLLEELQRVKEQASLADLEAPMHSQTEGPAEGGASSLSVSAPKVSIPSSAHHYCFSLELCSLRKLSLTHSIAATLRYTPYHLFCSAGPVMTNPPAELHRNMEASLPQSYCSFEFATMPQLLMDTFIRAPLVVEVWHRDSSSKDELVGLATVELSPLLTNERNRRRRGEHGWKQTHKDWVPVIGVERPSEKVAELSFKATLEDLGMIKAKEVLVSDSSREEVGSPPQASSHPHAHAHAATHRRVPSSLTSAQLGSAPPAASRDMLEYRKALELELWKEEQEELFDDELKKRELSLMQGLGEEWTKRNRVKEALLQKKEMEYDLMEEKFHKSVADLEKKEQQLAEAELQTQRLKRELQSEYELAQKKLQETSNRLQQECDHRVALEREKVKLMEEERGRLLQQITDGESRYKLLEKELQHYREQHGVRPEFRLQSDINMLTLEKVELERKLETTTKSKLHYKQQWGRALKELARFKQREQENAMTRLKKQQAELEAMRLRYLATEEKEAVRQDRQELEEIRNELNRLKQQEERLGPALSRSDSAPCAAAAGDSGEDHLSRLVEERDTLLRTGVYTQDDRIVAELNRQIQEGLSHRANL